MDLNEHFKGEFRNFISNRIIFCNENRIMSQDETEANEKQSKLFNTIRELLGENQKLILDLEAEQIHLENIKMERFYRQGIADAELFKGELPGLIKQE